MRRTDSSLPRTEDLTDAVHELLEAGVIEMGPHLELVCGWGGWCRSVGYCATHGDWR